MFGKRFTVIAAVIGLMLFMVFTHANVASAVTPHTGNAMWVELPTFNVTASAGTLFNVTVYGISNTTLFTYQIQVDFNSTTINCTRVGYTDAGLGGWLTGHTPAPVAASFNNTRGIAGGGESLLDSDTLAAGNGSLMWFEFKVNYALPTGGNLTGLIHLDTTSNGCFFLDPDLNTLTTTSFFDSQYTLLGPIPDTTPPTINAPTRNPAASVSENQSVIVSVNVTDTGSGVENVTLSYSNNTLTWINAGMTLNSTTSLWTATIPGYLNSTFVQYNITAYDNAGNMAKYPVAPAASPSYTVIPEFTLVMLIVLLTSMTAMIVMLRKKYAILK